MVRQHQFLCLSKMNNRIRNVDNLDYYADQERFGGEMELLYRRTRGEKKAYTASEAVLKGLAKDGGLFVADQIPLLQRPTFEFAGLSYHDTAYVLVMRFCADSSVYEL